MTELDGQVAIVTGAGKGIGRELAKALAARGAAVVVNNRSRDGQDPAGTVVEEIRSAGGTAVAEHSSVEAPGAAEAIVAAAIDNFGRLDLVVPNAAVIDRALFRRADPDRFREVMEINFMSAVSLTREALPHVREQSGRFLFITSTAGTYGEYGVASYAAAKGAVIAFAKTLALEVARDDVKVNLLCPYAATQMTEGIVDDAQAAGLAPELVVPAAIWLLGPDADVTGSTVVAAGNRFRSLAAGETGTVVFAGTDPVPDDAFADAAAQVMSLDGWMPYTDGMTAFVAMMSDDGQGTAGPSGG